MTEYLKEKFSVAVGGNQAYRDNHDRIFAKKEPEDGKPALAVGDHISVKTVYAAACGPAGGNEKEYVVTKVHDNCYSVLSLTDNPGIFVLIIKEPPNTYRARQSVTEQVREFHKKFGLPIGTTPAPITPERMQLRLKLIAEEFFELLAACELWPIHVDREGNEITAAELVDDAIEDAFAGYVDLVEVADALADIDFLVEGARLELGINGAPIAAEVARSNMSKLGLDGKPVYREDGKVTKGPNYSPPKIDRELRFQGWSGQ